MHNGPMTTTEQPQSNIVLRMRTLTAYYTAEGKILFMATKHNLAK